MSENFMNNFLIPEFELNNAYNVTKVTKVKKNASVDKVKKKSNTRKSTKNPKQKKSTEKRSRNGCQTCKQRKVKCDETHPRCNNCHRLDLKCSYAKLFHWGEETLNEGTTFGRSNQYKKKSINEKYKSFLKENKGSNIDLEDFKNQLNVSLTNMIKCENVPWLNLEKKQIYFINTNYDDFKEKLAYSKHTSFTRYHQHRNPLSNHHPINPSNIKLMNILSSFFINESKNNFNIYTNSNGNHNLLSQSSDSPTNFTPSNSFTNFANLLNSPSFQDLLNFDIEIPKFSLNDPSLINWNHFNDNADFCHFQFNCLSNDEKLLLNYFVNSICPTCICYPNFSANNEIQSKLYSKEFQSNSTNPLDTLKKQTNPYLYLIVPLAFQSKMVMDTIMATSAHQLFLLGNSKYEEISNDYSTKSIDQLPLIIQEKQNLESFDWDEILATILMLCFKEISSNCDYKSSWIIYLNCAKSFLKKVNIQTNYSPLCKFFARYFIVHEIMGETAWNEQKKINYHNNQNNTGMMNSFDNFANLPISIDDNDDNDDFMKFLINQSIQSNDNLNSGHSMNTNDEKVIDVVFGCCPFLISLIQKVSSLGRCYEDLEFESMSTKLELSKYILLKRDELEYEIKFLVQRIEIYEFIDDDRFLKNIEIIAEIKKLSTLLYLFARVDLESLHYSGGVKHKQFMDKYNEMQLVKNKLMGLYQQLPECPMSLLWPLFVFGLVCASDNDEERWFVLDKLIYLQKARELGSVKTAKDVLLAVWKELDLGTTSFRWKDMIKNRAESLSLA